MRCKNICSDIEVAYRQCAGTEAPAPIKSTPATSLARNDQLQIRRLPSNPTGDGQYQSPLTSNNDHEALERLKQAGQSQFDIPHPLSNDDALHTSLIVSLEYSGGTDDFNSDRLHGGADTDSSSGGGSGGGGDALNLNPTSRDAAPSVSASSNNDGGGGGGGANSNSSAGTPGGTQSSVSSGETKTPAPASTNGNSGSSGNKSQSQPDLSSDASQSHSESRKFNSGKLGTAATGGSAAPTIQVATQLSSRADGVIFVRGVLQKESSPQRSKIEIYSKNGDKVERLGALSTKHNETTQFQGVVHGKLDATTILYAKLVDVDTLDAVSLPYFQSVDTHSVQSPSLDTDLDGIGELLESMANQGDGNRDGIQDSTQPGVATLPDSRFGEFYTLAASSGVLRNVEAIAPQSQLEKLRLPTGSFGFTIDNVPVGQVVAVDMF